MKMNFYTKSRNNNQENENIKEIETYLKINKNENLISCFHQKSQKKIIKLKNSKKISYKFPTKNFSNIPIDKRNLHKIGDSFNFPSVLYIKKNKLDININNFDKILSSNPKRSILKKIFKKNTFTKSLESYTSKNDMLNQKNTNNNFEYPKGKIDEKINLENNLREFIHNSSNKNLKLFISKKILSNNKNIYDLPPLNYYKNNLSFELWLVNKELF